MSKSLVSSLIIHFFFLVFFFSLSLFKSEKKEEKTLNFSIVEKEVKEIAKKPKIVINASKQKDKKNIGQTPRKEVFGVKRRALADAKSSIQVKAGNNLNKEVDKKRLSPEDSSLPTPSEEFLITSMPRAVSEIRPEYPSWAKDEKIKGSVIFEILIDDKGIVRSAKVLKGLHPKLDLLAKNALLKFKFKPAYIEKKATAVRIKYAIKYVLED